MKFKTLLLVPFCLLLGHCTLLAQLGIDNNEEQQASEDLMLATAAYLATQEDDERDLGCTVVSSGSGSSTSSYEVLKIPSSTTSQSIFTGDDVRATSAVYFVFDSVAAGEVWNITNFGFWTTGQGEGTVAPYDGTSCPLDSTDSGGRSSTTNGNASVSYSINNNAGTTTLTFNTAGGYIVQFYTGGGTNTENGANALLTKSN